VTARDSVSRWMIRATGSAPHSGLRGFGASTPMPHDFPWTLDLLWLNAPWSMVRDTLCSLFYWQCAPLARSLTMPRAWEQGQSRLGSGVRPRKCGVPWESCIGSVGHIVWPMFVERLR
jgi:hypothetical protein